MIVVVEGIDKVGKTTLAKKLEDAGFIYLKDKFMVHREAVKSFPDYSLGKCESFLKVAEDLHSKGKNVVIDRLHLTEIVYGAAERGYWDDNKAGCFAIDMLLANLGAILCYIEPSNIKLSNELHGSPQEKKSELFEHVYRLSSMKKIKCNYETIDETVLTLLNEAFDYDFYFASPFFNPEQVEREERMIKHLRSLGFRVFSPKENCHLDAKADSKSRQDVFKANCESINNSRAVFAVTDGKDMGTIWEAGYAYGINKPILYYAETLGNNLFNLMLAESGRDVFLSQDEVTYGSVIDGLLGHIRRFRGDIE